MTNPYPIPVHEKHIVQGEHFEKVRNLFGKNLQTYIEGHLLGNPSLNGKSFRLYIHSNGTTEHELDYFGKLYKYPFAK